ncbi:MAG: Uma2 family endonuclease [Verrucomicrobiae bacterium]|nr:Uma2 family endonuclease [Verrucomicrobiae bacterium]
MGSGAIDRPARLPEGTTSAIAAATRRVWTEAELQALPSDSYDYELVDGTLVMSPKNSFLHGDLCSRLSAALVTFNEAHQLGVVLDSSTGFWMRNRNCRAPDISFVTRSRMKSLGFSRKETRFFPGGPDLAVEVLAPSNTRSELDARLRDFFDSGTRLAWVIHPMEQFVEICRSPIDRQIVGAGAFLDGGEVLPGFQFPVANLFHVPDWD